MKRVVILGRGYIGSYLKYRIGQSVDVHAFSRSELDYHNTSIFDNMLANIRPDLVISAFGFTGKPNVDQAEVMKNECWHLNVNVPLAVAMACSEKHIPLTHISSGCIFSGYENAWGVDDDPNFGMFDHSSFYSKTKHAFEMVSKTLPVNIVRIRMPFSGCSSSRNYIMKLLRYDRLIDCVNSKTCVEDAADVINAMIQDGSLLQNNRRQIIHVVNPEPMSTSQVAGLINEFMPKRRKWSFVQEWQLELAAPRSNCVLHASSHEATRNMPTEYESMKRCISMLARISEKEMG